MNKIEKLIEELCPEGVSWGPIGEHVDYERPRKYIVASTDYSDSNPTPVLTAGQTFILGHTDEAFGIYEASPVNPVIIFDDFTTAFKWVDFPFKVKSSAMKILTPSKNSNLSLRFLFHYMGVIGFSATEHRNHWISIYSQMKIPVPPVAVQQEIVLILDKFTELEAELEAEVGARASQYEALKSQLLTEKSQWVSVTLGQIGRVAMCKRIFKEQTSPNGDIPFFKIGTFGRNPDSFIDYKKFSEYRSKFSYPRTGDILISASGTIGKRVVFNGEDAYFQDTNIIWLEHDESKILNGFLYHLYSTVKWKTEGGTISRLYNSNFLSTEVAIPPLDEQRAIAEILDSFEVLTTDKSSGLPGELVKRRQQYEYYRNKLLAFKELKAS